jgi:hypothetical protein
MANNISIDISVIIDHMNLYSRLADKCQADKTDPDNKEMRYHFAGAVQALTELALTCGYIPQWQNDEFVLMPQA